MMYDLPQKPKEKIMQWFDAADIYVIVTSKFCDLYTTGPY